MTTLIAPAVLLVFVLAIGAVVAGTLVPELQGTIERTISEIQALSL